MVRQPIKVEPRYPNLKLDPASRLNYAKIYTIECNVKVRFIGKIHQNSSAQVVSDYNNLHPQLSSPFGNTTQSSRADTYKDVRSNYGGSSGRTYGVPASGFGGHQESNYGTSGYGGGSGYATGSTSTETYVGSRGSGQGDSYTLPRTSDTTYTVSYNTSTTTSVEPSSAMYPGVPVENADGDDTQQDLPASTHQESYDQYDDIYEEDY